MPKDKSKARTVKPQEPTVPVVHAGEVLGTLHTELSNLMAEAARYRLLIARLDAYEREHPAQADVLKTFIKGG